MERSEDLLSVSQLVLVIELDFPPLKFQYNTHSFLYSKAFVPGTVLFSLHPIACTNYKAKKLF